jgi:hypothetical protein
MVPIGTERSASPPGFSRSIMRPKTFAGSISPAWSISSSGLAERIRGMNRARIAAPQAYRPVELKA